HSLFSVRGQFKADGSVVDRTASVQALQAEVRISRKSCLRSLLASPSSTTTTFLLALAKAVSTISNPNQAMR
ncbi:MAG: hypothetical protein QXS54_00970, partial [Candidatus Methanomethylicaceae archaeon]